MTSSDEPHASDPTPAPRAGNGDGTSNGTDGTPDPSGGEPISEDPSAEAPPAGSAIETRTSDDAPLLYTDLDAPSAIDPDPPPQARWLAFGSILLGGLLGGLIGYGTGDLMSDSAIVAPLGALLGAALGAGGVGIVAGLTLRAMNEWQAVQHPESETRASSGLVTRDMADSPTEATSSPADSSPDEPTTDEDGSTSE